MWENENPPPAKKGVINDGGPAFPFPPNENWQGCSGMTLRDWFAGQALAGMLASPLLTIDVPEELPLIDVVPQKAYEYADAIIKAREEKP